MPTSKNPVIKILLWNANGLHQHKNEFQTVLNNNKIDIALISETHFTDNNYFNIYNYTLYKTNHPDGTAHAGAAIYISKNIQHNETSPYQELSIQASSVTIKINSIPITISAVYCPPNYNSIR